MGLLGLSNLFDELPQLIYCNNNLISALFVNRLYNKHLLRGLLDDVSATDLSLEQIFFTNGVLEQIWIGLTTIVLIFYQGPLKLILLGWLQNITIAVDESDREVFQVCDLLSKRLGNMTGRKHDNAGDLWDLLLCLHIECSLFL